MRLLIKALAYVVLVGILVPNLCCQSSNIGYSVSGLYNYYDFDGNLGLSNSQVYGVQGGISFGKEIELRGIYLLSRNIDTDFSDYNSGFSIPNALPLKEIDFKLYGGEVRFNLGRHNIYPFLSVGSGILETENESQISSKHFYAKADLGVTFSINRTVGFSLYGNYMGTYSNPFSSYYTQSELVDAGVNLNQFDNDILNNFGVGGALTFYLGGQNRVDENYKYFQALNSKNYKGASFLLDIDYTILNFNDDLGFNDTDLWGVSLGANFGSLVRLKAYYKRNLDEGELFDFGHLSMYGGKAVFNLASGSGFIPFVNFGMGYIDIDDEYVSLSPDGADVSDEPYANFGGGFTLPLSKGLKFFGSVDAIITTEEMEIEEFNPNSFQNSLAVSFGVNFNLGKSFTKQKTPRELEQERQLAVYESNLSQLESEAASLREQLVEAVDQNLAQEEIIKRANALTDAEDDIQTLVDEKPVAVEEVASGLPEDIEAYIKEQTDIAVAAKLDQQKQPVQLIEIPVLEEGEVFVRFGSESNSRLAVTETQLDSIKAVNSTNVQTAEGDSGFDKLLDEIQKLNTTIEEMQRDQLKMEANILAVQSGLTQPATKRSNPSTQPGNSAESQLNIENQKLREELRDRIDALNERELDIAKKEIELKGKKRAHELDLKEKELKIQQKRKELRSDRNLDDIINEARVKGSEDERSRNHAGEIAAASVVTGAAIATAHVNEIIPTLGYSFGRSSALTIGAKANMNFNFSKSLVWMPEIYFKASGRGIFGMSMNVIKDIKVKDPKSKLSPYFGGGLGIQSFKDSNDRGQFQGVFNLILGTKVRLNDKSSIYLDYTNRNIFKHNHITVGYVFKLKQKAK